MNAITRGNRADTDDGGLYVGASSVFHLYNVRVQDNQVGQDGAGLLVSASSVEIGADPATCQNALPPPDHYCSEFRNNATSGNGGAIGLELAANLTLSDTALISNSASLGSAVMSQSNGDHLEITNSLFTDNTGEALYLAADAFLDLVHTTFAANDWAIDINDNGAVVNQNNNIVWGNGFGVESAIPLAAGCSISQNGVGGANSDPLFQTTGRGDYRLASGSPAIDACAVGVDADLDGIPRPQGADFDMGAFEAGLPLVLLTPLPSIPEGDAGLTLAPLVVSLSETSQQTITLDLASVPVLATAGVDFNPPDQTLTLPPGVISQSVTLEIVGDTTYEGDDAFELHFSNVVGAALTFTRTDILIADDDPLPSLALLPTVVIEGDTGAAPLTLTVNLSNPSAFTVTVNYATGDETALAGADYVAASGTLTFAPSALAADIVVAILGDELPEPEEQFDLWLTDPVGATLAVSEGAVYVTIVDNDAAHRLFLPLLLW